jgi:hypothetical protein
METEISSPSVSGSLAEVGVRNPRDRDLCEFRPVGSRRRSKEAGEKKKCHCFLGKQMLVVVNEEGGYNRIKMVKTMASSTIQKVSCHPVKQREAACHHCENVLKARSWEVMIWLPT